jgi:hypothetical protein
MDDKVPPPVSRTLIPDELPIVTVVSGVADVLDQAIDRLVSALPSAPAAARDGLRTEAASSDSTDVKGPDAEAVRNAIADRYEQRYYADMLASGAPEHVARDVSRGIARSIRGQGRGVWRSIGRGFGRMFRWW